MVQSAMNSRSVFSFGALFKSFVLSFVLIMGFVLLALRVHRTVNAPHVVLAAGAAPSSGSSSDELVLERLMRLEKRVAAHLAVDSTPPASEVTTTRGDLFGRLSKDAVVGEAQDNWTMWNDTMQQIGTAGCGVSGGGDPVSLFHTRAIKVSGYVCRAICDRIEKCMGAMWVQRTEFSDCYLFSSGTSLITVADTGNAHYWTNDLKSPGSTKPLVASSELFRGTAAACFTKAAAGKSAPLSPLFGGNLLFKYAPRSNVPTPGARVEMVECFRATSRVPLIGATYPTGTRSVPRDELLSIGEFIFRDMPVKVNVSKLIDQSRANIQSSFDGQEIIIFSKHPKHGGNLPLVDEILYKIYPGQDEYKIASMNLQKGDMYVDIGGNIGITMVLIIRKFPGIRAITFEPLPENFFYLVWNALANCISSTSLTPYNGGLSSHGKPFEINVLPEGTIAASIMPSVKWKGTEFEKSYVKSLALVQTFSLGKVLERHGHTGKHTALIKLDCEGCEFDLVPHYPAFFRNSSILTGEWHADPKGTGERGSYFDQHGYADWLAQHKKEVRKASAILCDISRQPGIRFTFQFLTC